MSKVSDLKERIALISVELREGEKELAQIQRDCEHPNADVERERDSHEGRSYWRKSCPECERVWCER